MSLTQIYTFSPVLGINVSRDNLNSVLNALERLSEIKWMAVVTGRFDIVARAAFASTEDLSLFLRETLGNIKGINNSESFICLETPKGQFIPLE
jgi:DNA-binding Lrp family transcriptional regulator